MGENPVVLQEIDGQVSKLANLLENSLVEVEKVSPIYKAIANKILTMVNDDKELSAWDAKDLLKLLDLSNKAQLEPIKKLTDLIHAIQSMRETSAMGEKMRELTDVVNAIKTKQDDLVIEAVDVEDIESVEIVDKK